MKSTKLAPNLAYSDTPVQVVGQASNQGNACRNTLNGRLYKDDPTIFAWDLINEPRCDCFPDKIPAPPELVSCRPECAGKMQACSHSSLQKSKMQHGKYWVNLSSEAGKHAYL